MADVITFPSFISSYRKLLENKGKSILVEFYHYDIASEPSVSTVSCLETAFMGAIDEVSYINFRLKDGTDYSFNDEHYNTNISNGAIVFSSKHHDEIYCIIEFC